MNDIYAYTIPVFTKHLGGLKSILAKAKDAVASGAFSEDALIKDALAPDMFAFARQVQIATDHAKGAAARLSGTEAPKFEDTEATLDELMVRIDKTVAYLATITEASFKDAAGQKITIVYFPGKYMTGFGYASEYAIPNFYFHLSMAYAIIRKNGVAIGKADFMNGLPLFDEAV